jgi:hypothetical protein
LIQPTRTFIKQGHLGFLDVVNETEREGGSREEGEGWRRRKNEGEGRRRKREGGRRRQREEREVYFDFSGSLGHSGHRRKDSKY